MKCIKQIWSKTDNFFRFCRQDLLFISILYNMIPESEQWNLQLVSLYACMYSLFIVHRIFSKSFTPFLWLLHYLSFFTFIFWVLFLRFASVSVSTRSLFPVLMISLSLKLLFFMRQPFNCTIHRIRAHFYAFSPEPLWFITLVFVYSVCILYRKS